MPRATPCPLAEPVRDALLARLDRHFADPAVKARLVRRLDLSPAAYTRAVQALALRLFPESFDEPGPGLVPAGGVPGAGANRMAAFAAGLEVVR